ncbi:MAG: hypothetical protein AAF086_06230 [Planctomycetota bacterium]
MKLIKSHYRTQSKFTAKGLVESAGTVWRLTERGQRLRDASGGVPEQIDQAEHPVVRAFLQALADDLNVSEAMTIVHAWLASPSSDTAESYGVLLAIDAVSGVWELASDGSRSDDTDMSVVTSLCTLIDVARSVRDFAAADGHRQHLIQPGHEVRSSSNGASAHKKFA